MQASSSPVSISRQKQICLFSLYPEALVGTADPQKGHPGSTPHGYCHCFPKGTACNSRTRVQSSLMIVAAAVTGDV